LFQVSVIIPVYNAVDFLGEAVLSAIQINEVKEVILIEDGSKDDSLKLCYKLSEKFPKVTVHTHQGGINKGASASRNLGIKLAKCEFVSFLDADDWYEPDRFEKDKIIFSDSKVMATYSLSSIKYENNGIELFGTDRNLIDEVGFEEVIPIYKIIINKNIVLGHTNCNTFRKSVLVESGGFDERLELHQDSELWNRIARKHLFYPGNLTKPISFARRHDGNRITLKSIKSQIKYDVVRIDNIGIENLYDFEKHSIINHISRVISNPLKINFIRKSILHGLQIILKPVDFLFIPMFYKWGMWYFGYKIQQ
jgi:glycosyltransferase involved in cell wall biosynthesis